MIYATPEPRTKLTLASEFRSGFGDVPGTASVQVVCDALKKSIDDPDFGWPAAIPGVVDPCHPRQRQE